MKHFMIVAVVLILVTLGYTQSVSAGNEVEENKKLIGSYLVTSARNDIVRSYPGNNPRFIQEKDRMLIVDSVDADCNTTSGSEPCLVIESFSGAKYYIPAFVSKAPGAVLTQLEEEKTAGKFPSGEGDSKNIKQHIGKSVWTISSNVEAASDDSTKPGRLPINTKYSVVDVLDYDYSPQSDSLELCVVLDDSKNQTYYIVYRLFNEYTFAFNKSAIEERYPKSWGKRIINLVIEGKIIVGMTREQVEGSWGVPSNVNTTIGSYGTHEQWVYSSGNYVYFEDGVLTTIQTSR